MRILFAPEEICGQMQLLVETFRQKGYFATAVTYEEPGFTEYVNDVNMGFNNRQPRLWRAFRQSLFAAWAVPNYDVFHFFFGRSLLNRRLDLPWLKRLGKNVLVHFHGSDIRNSDFFIYKSEFFSGELATPPPLQNPQQRKLLERWRRYADIILVSTPDLLRIVPEATLVQQAIDLSQWEYEPEPLGGNPQEIRILHAPTSRYKKGTDFVLKAIEELKSDGYPVKLLLVEGVPHNEVKQLYKTCHIGIDRVLDGAYGVLSIEMMALGKPVICYIDPELAHYYRPNLPIVSATPLDLTEKLKTLIDDQSLRNHLGQEGREYVEKWHDVEVIADQLLELYQK
ncbi:glycosyltransferase family 4 protein [Chloroflexota bacterium]